MDSSLPHPIVVSRPAWARAVQPLRQWLQRVAAALDRWRINRRVIRQRERDRQAMRQISPHLLRDIGAPDEMLDEARRWQGSQRLGRSGRFRGD